LIADLRSANPFSNAKAKSKGGPTRRLQTSPIFSWGALKMREWKMRECKLQEKTAEVEIAGVENTGAKTYGKPLEQKITSA